MKSLLIVLGALAILGAGRRDAYVLAHGPNDVTISNTDVEIVRMVRERYRGDYLWVRRGGQSWLIRNADWLDRASALFAPQRALAPEQAAVAREEELLDREEDRLENARGDENRARLGEIHRRQAEVSRREAELDRRENELDLEAESKLWPLVDAAIRQGVATPMR